MFFFVVVPRFLVLIVTTSTGLTRVMMTTIMSVRVRVTLSTQGLSYVHVLPRLPLTLMLRLVCVVVHCPMEVIVRGKYTRVLLLGLMVNVSSQFRVVPVLCSVRPYRRVALGVLCALIVKLVLSIRCKQGVTVHGVRLLRGMVHLFTDHEFVTPRVVRTASRSVITDLVRILSRVLVRTTKALNALSSSGTREAALSRHVIRLLPICLTLVVESVGTVGLMTFEVRLVTVRNAPSRANEACRRVVRRGGVRRCCHHSAGPPYRSKVARGGEEQAPSTAETPAPEEDLPSHRDALFL